MQIDRTLLPTDRSEWHGFLRDYFCDKDAIVIEERDGIHLRLEWPSGADRHVDPALNLGLAWWGRGVTLGSMWSALWREGRIMTSLFDTWTLLSWSEWLTRVPPEIVAEVVVLHVDDHRDLGSPRLFVRDIDLIDAITGNDFRLGEPASVRQAIESGAIGMGSFLSPFFQAFPNVQIRHLCQPPKMQDDVVHRLVLRNNIDTLLDRSANRFTLELEATTSAAGGIYIGTSNPHTWARDIQGRPALVHIDMDYFNNRYDGDSAWQSRGSHLDPDLPAILLKVDELIDALAASKVKIEDVVIAYSPGFFPAEYWEPVDRSLRAGLVKIL